MQVGASPRGSLALLKLARCRAALSGRDFATPDDVKAVAVPALAHRLTLRPELWVERRRADDIVRELLEQRADAGGRAAGSARPRAVTRSATGKLHVYVVLAGLGLLGALTLGRPELAAIAAPFALFVALGLVRSRHRRFEHKPRSTGSASSRSRHVDLLDRAVRGADRRAPRARSSTCPRGSSPRRRTRSSSGSAPGERRELEVPLLCTHWGTYQVGGVVWRVRDAFGLLVYEGTGGRAAEAEGLSARRDRAASSAAARDAGFLRQPGGAGTAARASSSRTCGRSRPGDRIRRVNWRATARRGEPWVNEMHPERNADVVLFLDTFAEARRDDLGTLDIGVRAAASLAALYLREKDRVGRRVVRRCPQLADGHLRDDPALPHRRLAARCARSSSATPGRTST